MSKKYTSGKPIKVLYEDDQFMAFYKPAGILSVPTGSLMEKHKSLEDVVNEYYREEVNGVAGPKLHPCHRLDRETSGVIFFAKGKMNQQALMDLFHKRMVHKKYIVFVHGRMERPSGTIRIPVKDAYSDKFSPASEGKDACTKYKVLETRRHYSIVEGEPVTGRTNQLRIHFKEIGHPIVGENKYIFRKDYDLRFKRTALHAAEISFKHPFTGKDIEVKAQLSADMMNFLERNRR
ncbi:MAG: RluA family pseudouridine synthase [Candidatus Omnitrophica bacterium]|nr:RluA family pseudouridine synthase [Candidatus Omnitrophota bacterium]